MKKIILSSLCSIGILMAAAQVKMPAPSPAQTVKQDFALSSIELTYSRPVVKGRKIMGDLVPMGKIWRLGANAATKIKFNDPVTIKDKKIDSGTYVLYATPGEKSWDFVLNKGLSNWGTSGYKSEDDVAKFTVPVETTQHTESFTMQFTDVKPESCNLEISWEKTKLIIPIKADIRDKMRASIDEAMKGEKKPYAQAAQYYMDFEKDYNKALTYITSATDTQKDAFWLWLNKARIEKQLGKNAEARKSAETSLRLATAAKNDDYIKMNNELLAELK